MYDFSNNRLKILGPSLNGSRGIITGLSAHELITAVKSVPLEAAETQVKINNLDRLIWTRRGRGGHIGIYRDICIFL